ncbi:MAG: CPBP family intramembrane metalloprotease [Planctomycetes bacterium]|nr:CPBP family intramembrane metalloprotease [Planctomycetota bacterium]
MTNVPDTNDGGGAPRRRRRDAKWGAGVLFLGFVVLFFGQLSGATLVKGMGLPDGWQLVGASLGFLLVILLAQGLIRIHGVEAEAELGLDRSRLRGLATALLFFLPHLVLFLTAALIAGLIAQLTGGEQHQQESMKTFLAAREDLPLFVGLGLVATVCAPLAEELLFRGFFFGFLRRSVSFWPAATIQGLVFGALHIEAPAAWVFLIPLGVMGIFLAWLRERSSLWTCIFLHAIHNTTMLLAAPYVVEQGG